MIINDKHRIAFVHIPKSAGTTVRYALMDYDDRRTRYFDAGRSDNAELGPLDYAHLPLQTVAELYPDDFGLLAQYRSFALIRDPKARFASSLHEYLHWNAKVALSEMSDEERTRIVREVILKLSSLGEQGAIADASLIHFSRQSDYVELDGKRIVSDLYAAEDVNGMLSDIAQMLNATIDLTPRNQRKSYRWEGLRVASEIIQKPIQAVLPIAIWQPAFRKVRSAFVKAGLFRFEKDRDFSELFDEEVEQFVRSFYRRDFELRAEINRQAASQSETRAGVRQFGGAKETLSA